MVTLNGGGIEGLRWCKRTNGLRQFDRWFEILEELPQKIDLKIS